LLRFFESRIAISIGWILVVLSVIIVSIGIYRYFQEKKFIKRNFQS
jgi:uncharacterized membrane protein YidH (DUF202 family)